MGETIRITASDGHELDAYRADPEAPARAGLVVIQEIFGVNDHIRDVADGFAADGFAVIAPALFDRAEPGVQLGYVGPDRDRGLAIHADVGWDGPVLDIAAAVAALAPAGRVGVVGYCWGGSLAWLAACRLDVDCSVGYYGGQIKDHLGEKPRCPVMLQFGDTDESILLEDVDAIRAAHGDVPVHVYPGGHGFNCDRRPSHHPESAVKARERTLAFFAEHLG